MHEDVIQNKSTNLNTGNNIRLGGYEDEVKDVTMNVGWCVNVLLSDIA